MKSDVLTPQQREVLRRLARGQTQGEIAESMVVSVWTVRNHLQEARDRTKKTTFQLIAYVAGGDEWL